MKKNKPLNTQEYKHSFDKVLLLIDEAKHQVYKYANKTLIELYWNVGLYISDKTTEENLGKNTVEDLAQYIKQHNPNIKGFSKQNIWRMKQFYETYKENQKLSPLVREVSWCNNHLSMSGRKSDEVVEYALSRSLSTTVIADYETELIPKQLLKSCITCMIENSDDKYFSYKYVN